ncbi:hypothetical protein IH979_03095 [Patescibacteria group bacterium]|nr:hypothetical protein [Patescibacteria group bacterium]
MPKKGGAKKAPTARRDDLTQEIKKLTEATQELRQEMQLARPRTVWKKITQNLFAGLLKGVGFILGTTIVAGLMFLLLLRLIQSPGFQRYLGESITEVIEESISGVLPEERKRFRRQQIQKRGKKLK